MNADTLPETRECDHCGEPTPLHHLRRIYGRVLCLTCQHPNTDPHEQDHD